MADKITPEAIAELRHLHVEHRRITKAIAEFAPISADTPEDLVAEYDVATDRVLRLAHLHLGNLLDALAAAEAERDKMKRALEQIIEFDWWDGLGDEPDGTDGKCAEIARTALGDAP